MDLLFELFSNLPRQGPGDNESTRKAYSFLKELPPKPTILDIGCGSGMQTLELAIISDGKVIAIDIHQPFLEELSQKAKNLNLLDKIEPLNLSMFDLEFEENSFDVIWSEGALYIYGLENALKDWQKFLKNKGYFVFSEVCWFKDEIPQELRDFWLKEYPAIKSIEMNLKLIAKNNLNIIAHFKLPESSWWDNLYIPFEKNIEKKRIKYADDKTKLEQINEMSIEIDMFRKYSDYYGYSFFITQKQ
ncbi:MAG: class I SAM-dependent methyltransferase [Promethearchaeota archaeon]|nr:MAG: class I SAM-dependent methyltransferase [Candidatus Lokiarchaeota archaeon]